MTYITEGTIYTNEGYTLELGEAKVKGDTIIDVPNGWARVLRVESNGSCWIELVLKKRGLITSEVYKVLKTDYLVDFKGSEEDRELLEKCKAIHKKSVSSLEWIKHKIKKHSKKKV